MSDYDKSEFDERLIELNNWQIEQQEKLKNFQDTQRRLLDSEHEKILSSLKTHNYDDRHNSKSPIFNAVDSGSESDTDRYRSTIPNYIFNFKPDAIKLREPNVNLCSIKNGSHIDEAGGVGGEGINKVVSRRSRHSAGDGDGDGDDCDDDDDHGNGDDLDDDVGVARPRRFLKRGEGLARFRMTLDDFKSPPDIYREKRFKTYLTQRPDFNRRKRENVKASCKGGKRTVSKSVKSVPVNIYVADNSKGGKSAMCNQLKGAKSERGMSCPKRKEVPKVPVKSLALKPDAVKERPESVRRPVAKPMENVKASERKMTEKQIKKDEHELKMFEMLEGKIDDGSLSPNSSLVARFMEESMSSTPSKPIESTCDNNAVGHSYTESLRALQRQYLTEEQMDRLQGESNNDDNDDGNNNDVQSDDDDDLCGIGYNNEGTSGEDMKDLDDELKETCVYELEMDADKISIPECVDSKQDDGPSGKASEPCLSQREIAIKLQRKALQDNVKSILNWNGQTRRKPVRRVNPKPDPKPKNADADEERIVFDSGLLQQRLDELSKEIDTFKKENKTLNQLQRECNGEKLRLERERREFSKVMEEEREKFEARMAEEQRKLQRDKAVFDRYCKHIKSQPNKKEREEIANLKKEVERLTEAIATKESRWGASQARLRNQIKNLEKENAELRSEVEKLRKQTTKKAVTFERGKNVNARIIHAINSELGKLKPHLIATAGRQKSQSLSGRDNSALRREKKPGMRRIKSVPDLNVSASVENKTTLSESARVERCRPDSPPSGSGDRDCGKEQTTESPRRVANFNGSEAAKTNVNNAELNNSDIINGNASESGCFPIETDSHITELRKSIRGKHLVESVLHETLFETRDRGDHNNTATSTITEIKRRLEHLNLLHNLNGDGDRNVDNDDDCDARGGMKCHGASSESDDSSNDDFDRDNVTVQRNCTGRRLGQFYPDCHHPKLDHATVGSSVREKTFDDGRREIFYPNGNIKKISPDGRIVKMIYYNGDLKETDVAEGSEKYFYAETKTWHTTYKDGLEVLEFSNGQTERRHPDGSSEILFPNGCVRYCDPFGKDEWRFVDGTVIKTDKNGHKVLLLPNGQKETHTKEYKKREYPDGTVKLLYADGTQETRYATGRVRLKDRDGNLVMDSGGIR